MGIFLGYFLTAQSYKDSADYYFDQAKSFQYVSFDSMRFYAKKIYKLGIDNQDKVLIAKYHAVIGVALEEQGKYDSAKIHHEEALQIGMAVMDSNIVSVSYQHLGVIQKDLGNYDKALEHFLEAAKISEKIGKYYTSAMSYLSTSQINFALGRYDDAITYISKTVEIGQENKDTAVISSGFIERGNIKVMTGDLDGGLSDYIEARKVMELANIRDGYSGLIGNIGAVNFFKGDYRKALQYYHESKDEAEISDDPVMIGTAFQCIGEAHIYLKEYNQAEIHLKKGLSVLLNLRNKPLIITNYQYLFDLEQARGDYKVALEYFKMRSVYEDSVLNEQTLNRISDLKIQYETEKKEQEIKTLQAQTHLDALEIQQKRNQVLGMSISAILLLIGIVLYNSRKRYKLRVQLAEEKETLQKTRFKAVIDAEENERKRIAQELHDGLGQLLSTVRITISGVGEAGNPKVKSALTLVDQSIDEVRSISHNLMPNALIAVGLKSALTALVRKINESGQIKVTLNTNGEMFLDETKTISMYRVIQELVNNALKYAQSPAIEINIDSEGSETTFSIIDHGTGFDTSLIQESKGIGWSNIYSRVDLIGGKINIYSKLDEGTTVKISIPDDRNSDQAATG